LNDKPYDGSPKTESDRQEQNDEKDEDSDFQRGQPVDLQHSKHPFTDHCDSREDQQRKAGPPRKYGNASRVERQNFHNGRISKCRAYGF
jgi:hypothetical protein